MRESPVLPRTGSLLLQHIAAYADLLTQELALSGNGFRLRLTGLLLLAASLIGATTMLCVAIIAANWDTPRRMIAIYVLLAVFVGLAVVAAGYVRNLRLRQPQPFARLRHEWRLDRELMADLLSGHDEQQSPLAPESDERG